MLSDLSRTLQGLPSAAVQDPGLPPRLQATWLSCVAPKDSPISGHSASCSLHWLASPLPTAQGISSLLQPYRAWLSCACRQVCSRYLSNVGTLPNILQPGFIFIPLKHPLPVRVAAGQNDLPGSVTCSAAVPATPSPNQITVLNASLLKSNLLLYWKCWGPALQAECIILCLLYGFFCMGSAGNPLLKQDVSSDFWGKVLASM